MKRKMIMVGRRRSGDYCLLREARYSILANVDAITTSIPCEVRAKTVPSPFASFARLQSDTSTNQISLRAVTSDLNYSLVYAIQFGFSV